MVCDEHSKTRLLNKALGHLVELNWLMGVEGDRVKSQYLSLCSCQHVQEKLKTFDRQEMRLDEFLINLSLAKKAPAELI